MSSKIHRKSNYLTANYSNFIKVSCTSWHSSKRVLIRTSQFQKTDLFFKDMWRPLFTISLAYQLRLNSPQSIRPPIRLKTASTYRQAGRHQIFNSGRERRWVGNQSVELFTSDEDVDKILAHCLNRLRTIADRSPEQSKSTGESHPTDVRTCSGITDRRNWSYMAASTGRGKTYKRVFTSSKVTGSPLLSSQFGSLSGRFSCIKVYQ